MRWPCSLTVGATTLPSVTSDMNGRFAFDNLSMAGPVHIGGNNCTIPQCDKPAGTFPSLHYETIVVPNATNSLPTPVLLPPLNPTNMDSSYSATPGDPDTVLTVEGMEGLEMIVKAGSMTLAGGQPAADGQPIHLNQVHADDIPMPIPDGASPPFSWTLQPSGAMFDPPIQITYPNMSGLPAGSIAYFLSFNNATSRFEIIATGQVTGDGSRIVTDPGTGLSVAGWGCNCPPYSVTGDCDFDPCEGDSSGCCQGGPCCEDPDPCCNPSDPCCGNPDRCCNPDNPCCGSRDPCCNPSGPCCGNPNRCCNPDNPCCGSDDPCCNPTDPCCGSLDPCCNPDNPCCAAAAAVATADEPEASIVLAEAAPCCGEGADDPCCNIPDECCPCDLEGLPCCGGQCVQLGQICCDEVLCAPGQVCCDKTTCCDPDRCCGNGECCSQVCEECLNYGTLSQGTISVDDDPVCVGETITVRLTGVVDSGGLKRVDCSARMPIPSVKPTYTWRVTKPDGVVSGFGSVATFAATKAGPHLVTFTANAGRECPPQEITIGPQSAEAIQPDIVFDGLVEFQETFPGGLICVNNDDDDDSQRADKDDDPGSIANEDDLKTLLLLLNDLNVNGSGTLKILQGSSGGMVRLYENPDRSDPVVATPGSPFLFNGSDLPIVLHVEGVNASMTPRDITLEFEYTVPGGEPCKDIVKLSVAGIEFDTITEFSGQIHRNLDLIELSDLYPNIVFDDYPFFSPSTSPTVIELTGIVTDSYAPLQLDDVTINDSPVDTLSFLEDLSPPGQYVYFFGKTGVVLDDTEVLLEAKVTNGLNNVATDKISVVVSHSADGSFASRSLEGDASTPKIANGHPFTIEVTDPFRTANTLDVRITTDVDDKIITLDRTAPTSITFAKSPLYLVPDKLGIVDADDRVKTRLGGRVLVETVPPLFVPAAGTPCGTDDKAITVGALLLNATNDAHLDIVRAGMPRDVQHDTVRNNVLAMVGAPGDLPGLDTESGVPFLTATLSANTFRDVPSNLNPAASQLLRVHQDPTQPDFNLFKTDATKAILPMASRADVWAAVRQRTLVDVETGGFLRLDVPTGVGTYRSVEPVRGEIIVAVLVDGLGAGFPQDAFPGPLPPENLETMMASGLLPNFERLINNASAKRIRYDAHTTFPSITYSAWSSWVTGEDPKDHGVTGSNFYRRSVPSFDPFWCGATTDPSCDLGSVLLGGAGMQNPIDMVTFLSPLDGVFDFDVANVWSNIGTLNSAIRPSASRVSTIYELIEPYGFLSAVVYHFPFRGATGTALPGAWQGHVQHNDSSGRLLDLGTSEQLDNLMGLNAPHIRPPQLLTVYYAGYDTHIHNDPSYPTAGLATIHLAYTDKQLGTLVRLLRLWNLYDDAIFTFTGDHGLSRVAEDDTHSLVLEETFDEELEQIMRAAGFEPLDFALQTAHDAVLAINGGMAHIYVKNRGNLCQGGISDGADCLQGSDCPGAACLPGDWPDRPRYFEDVRVMAERFFDNNIGVLNDDPQNSNVGAFDLILVRDPAGGFSGPYEVLVKQGGSFGTMPLDQAEAIGMVDTRYVNFQTNMQRLQDVRSGDIIILSAGMCDNDGTGYYFGAPLPGWHGSLCASDMTIPIIFSFPRGSGDALSRFEGIVDDPIVGLPLPPGEARITDIHRTIIELLTLEAP